jgi:hypothetical protein
MGADRPQLGAGGDEQHLLLIDVPNEPIVNKIGERDTLGQIRTAGRSLFLSHCQLPLLSGSHGKKLFGAAAMVIGKAAARRPIGVSCGWPTAK